MKYLGYQRLVTQVLANSLVKAGIVFVILKRAGINTPKLLIVRVHLKISTRFDRGLVK
jgi:hypothetical protein